LLDKKITNYIINPKTEISALRRAKEDAYVYVFQMSGLFQGFLEIAKRKSRRF